jgi:hypothetical protein
MDIKFTPESGFDFGELMQKEHFILDLPTPISDRNIFNGFIVAKPRSSFMLCAINSVVSNVTNRLYGKTCLSVTGPHMLASIIPLSATSAELQFSLNEVGKQQITWRSKPAVKEFANYRSQMKKTHYSDQWITHAIYRDAPI